MARSPAGELNQKTARVACDSLGVLTIISNTLFFSRQSQNPHLLEWGFSGAGDEVRTHDIQLGKLTLYRLSYSRIRSFETLVEVEGFEPTTSCLQSRRSPSELHPRAPADNRVSSKAVPVKGCQLAPFAVTGRKHISRLEEALRSVRGCRHQTSARSRRVRAARAVLACDESSPLVA